MRIPDSILQLVDSVPNNTSNRFVCPECRGYNSLSITKEQGKVLWYCFKAQCLLKGKGTYLSSVSEIKQSRNTTLSSFVVPESVVFGLNSKVQAMLVKYHCIEAYKKGLFDVGYDAAQDRVCFVIRDSKGNIAGLIGRAVKNRKPKTLNYPGSSVDIPFICGVGKTLVLTEDCLSAISVTRIEGLSGLAILGSTFKDSYLSVLQAKSDSCAFQGKEHLTSLKNYDTVVIALDRDARKKAFSMKKKLDNYHNNVKLWQLNKDIKDQDDIELKLNYERILK